VEQEEKVEIELSDGRKKENDLDPAKKSGPLKQGKVGNTMQKSTPTAIIPTVTERS
jgi:hypothetical protein